MTAAKNPRRGKRRPPDAAAPLKTGRPSMSLAKTNVRPLRPAEQVAPEVDPAIEAMKAALRASVPDETPFVIPAELAPHELAAYVVEATRRANAALACALKNLSNIVAQKHASLPELHSVQRLLADWLEDKGTMSVLEKMTRDIVVGLIDKQGHPVIPEGVKFSAERAPKQVEVNGQIHRVHPWRNTTDPEKLEAFVRSKLPEGWRQETFISRMKEVATDELKWKPREIAIDNLVDRGELTQAERDALRYDLKWSLERPRTLKETDNE